MDLGTLQIERLIVHEVPRRLAAQAEPLPSVSEIDSPLTTELRHYFRERISASLAAAAYDVVFDPDSTSPVPKLVLDHLGPRTRNFIPASQEAAHHLYNCQTGVNPEGLLVIVQASLESQQRAFGVLKLEKEDGVHVRQATLNGKATFDIQHLHDLMLTKKTRVFKAGLFMQRGTELQDIEGLVSDNQLGTQPRTEVAEFFLRKFLGCKTRESPHVTTKRFFHHAEDFINNEVSDPARKARYHIALLAELQSETPSIDPRKFAATHFVVEDRQKFIEALKREQFPIKRFDKDVHLIKSQITRTQVDFKSGLAVFGPPETFDEHVKMTDVAGGRTRVEIIDELKRVHGRSR